MARKHKKQRKTARTAALILVFAVFFAGSYMTVSRFLSDSNSSAGTTSEAAETDADAAETESSPETPDDTSASVENTVDSEVPDTAAAETDSEEPEVSEPVSITVSCAGDCTLGTDENFTKSTSLPTYADEYGLEYFLSNVKDIFEADDLTIVNLEGTLTDSTTRMDKKFAFKGDPSYTEILTSAGVEACNMANNHSHDYGDSSYTDTLNAVAAAGLISFGYDNVAVTDVNGIKIGMIGVYELADGIGCESALESEMAAVKEQGAQLIIVSFHWGIEREYVPNNTQVTLAHKAVDLGANLIVGHHPHVLQGVETYNGVQIAYSLGNFCFGGNKNPSDKDTMIYQQTFHFVDGELQPLSEVDVNIIPCSLSSVSDHNDYRPTPATGEEADRIMEKIEKYSAEIG